MSKAVGFFKNIILTNKGKELLLSSNNNIDNSLEFTICKFGDGRYTEEEALTATDIKNAWKTQNLNTVRIDNSEDVPKLIIEITFSNKDMQEPKVLNELGIFAKDKQNETHLFAYSLSNVENGEEIEIENDYPTTFKISIVSKISNNTNVTNIIDPNGFLTKEVIELLKENIRNIAFRKIKGTLNAGERTITVSTDNLMPLSERLVLNIEGEIYFLDRDYTIDTKSNTITLKEPYRFDKDSMYEIIDPLPATYVKEQINEFIEGFKQLVSNSKVDFNEFKEQLKLEIQNKIDEFYNNLDSYIEQNRENLKGLSIKEVVPNGTDENGGNKYNVIREDNTVIGEIIAPKGIQGNGVSNVEFVRIDENGDTEYRFVLDNGSKTSTFIAPRGAKGDPFRIVKVYRSILEMQADLNNPEIHVGDMVAIDTGSVEDEDTGKLFVKSDEGFSYLLDLSGATGIQGPEGPKGRDGKDGLSIKEVVPNGTDENGGNKYNVIREDNTVIGEIVSPAYGKDKVSKSGDTMTGTLYINGVSNGLEIVDGINNKPRAVFQNSNVKIGVGLHPNHIDNFPVCVVDGNGENPQRIYHQGFKPNIVDVGVTQFGIGIGALPRVPKNEILGGIWRDSTLISSGITLPYDGTPTINFIRVDARNQVAYTGTSTSKGEIRWNKIYSENSKPTPKEIEAMDKRLIGEYWLDGNAPNAGGTNTFTVKIPRENKTVFLDFRIRFGSAWTYTNICGFEEYGISFLLNVGQSALNASKIIPISNSTHGKYFTFGAFRVDTNNIYFDVYYSGNRNSILIETTYVGGNFNSYSKISITDVRRTSEVGRRYDVYTTSNINEYCPYRVGDILTTTLPDNPAVTWVGTTWQKIEGKYLKGTSGISNAKQTGGSNTKTLSVANMPAHNHTATQPPHLHTQPPHTHTYSASATEPYGGYYGSGGAYPVSSRISSSAGGENTGSAQPVITVGNTGSGAPFNIEPEYYLVNFWLRLS